VISVHVHNEKAHPL